MGKLNDGLTSYFDKKTGELISVENETKGIIENQAKEIAEIKRVVESILSRMENGTYDSNRIKFCY